MTRWIALGLLALVACGAPPPENGARPLTLTPSEELYEATELAAEAWSAATGIAVELAPGGTLVELVDHLPFANQEGETVEACGLTMVSRIRRGDTFQRVQWIRIATELVGCHTRQRVISHEIGHALCEHGVSPRPPGGTDSCHSATGVMKSRASDGGIEIDEASLEVVCAYAPCSAFNPGGAP